MERLKTLAQVMQSRAAALDEPVSGSPAASPGRLRVQVYNADATSFHGNAVLVSGETDAVLLGIGLSRADALRITAMVLDSKKALRTIYIGWPDPDCHVGLEVLRQHFPHAEAVAAAPTLRKIEIALDKNRQLFGGHAPDRPLHLLPGLLQGTTLMLEQDVLEIRGIDESQAHRSYVWIPSIKTVVGGLNVFGGVHPWMACSTTLKERSDWSLALEAMLALQPTRVIAGCSLPGSPQDVSQIHWTHAYLDRFEAELAAATGSQALIHAMQRAYPDAGLPLMMHIGAQVNMGEMKW